MPHPRIPARPPTHPPDPITRPNLTHHRPQTPGECLELAARSAPLLQYHKTAMREVDGEAIEVPIQRPRNYELAVIEDKPLADRIWERLRKRAGAAIDRFVRREGCGAPLGLTHRLRCLRYTGDDRFEPHYDRIVEDDQVGGRGVAATLLPSPLQTHAATHLHFVHCTAARHKPVTFHKLARDHTPPKSPIIPQGRRSLITVLIYLNDGEGLDFNGGETLFLDARNLKTNPDTADALGVDAAAAAEAAVAAVAAGAGAGLDGGGGGGGEGEAAKAPVVVSVPPRMGRVTVFEHALYHSGARLKDSNGNLLGGGGSVDGGDGGAGGQLGGGDDDGGAESRGVSAGCKLVVRTDIMFETKKTAGAKANVGAEGGAGAGGLVFGRDDATFGNEDMLGGGGGGASGDASRYCRALNDPMVHNSFKSKLSRPKRTLTREHPTHTLTPWHPGTLTPSRPRTLAPWHQGDG